MLETNGKPRLYSTVMLPAPARPPKSVQIRKDDPSICVDRRFEFKFKFKAHNVRNGNVQFEMFA